MTEVISTPVVAPMPPLLNRERAILEFNRRVLAQARRADVPLLERLRYICIVSSNMDEFFEVRFADYVEAARGPGAGGSRGAPGGASPTTWKRLASRAPASRGATWRRWPPKRMHSTTTSTRPSTTR